MGATKRETGVLKLVHPGRYVEVHTEPITAAEVMRRNPRHSITRPDVFECPWFVVKREAVLVPGQVFFIVPNRKIYQLLKAKGHCSQPSSSRQMQSPRNHVNQQHHIQTSQITTYAGVTPMHQSHNPTLRRQFKNMRLDDLTSREQECDKKLRKDSQVEKKRTQQIIKQKSQEDSTTKFRFSSAYQKHKDSYSISTKLPKTDDPALESECSTSKQVTVLKSCLRKPDSYHNFRNLRVTFDLPINDERRQRRAPVCPTEFADFLNW